MTMLIHTGKGLTKIKIKKFFQQTGTCVFCQKIGHEVGYCPSKQSVPDQKLEFVEHLLSLPRLKLKVLEGRNWGDTLDYIYNLGLQLNKGNPWKDDCRPFSSLRKNLGFWKSIGADNSVLSWLSYGYQFKFQRTPKRKFFSNPSNIYQFEDFVDKEITTHLNDGSFVEVEVDKVKVVNPFLISVNSSGKPRRCDDLRYVNGFLASPMFKMQSLGNDVPNIVMPGQEMFTRDLEKAYYKIPIDEESSYYQCFFWKGKYYRSKVLLFGLCQAPFIFTKICRTIVRFFGAIMIRLVNFVDDFLFCDRPDRIQSLQKFVDFIFKLLGWTLSLKDNQIGERVRFLGFVVDSKVRKFFIPDKVREKVMRLIEVTTQSIAEGRPLSIQDIRRVTGKLISLKLAIPSVSIWIRDLLFHLPSDPEVDELVQNLIIDKRAIEGLKVIESMIKASDGSPFISPTVELDVFTDSGEIGWGATILGLETYGTFDSELIGKSSTLRELIGLLKFLEDPLGGHMKNKVVRFNMDSRCAIANLIHAGPVRELLPIVKKIWSVLDSNNVTPVFRWVSRETPNLRRVDELSKQVTFTLKDEYKQWFERQYNTRVLVVDHNKLADTLGWVISRREKCYLLAPKWEGKSWWTLLCDHSKRMITVDNTHIFVRGGKFPGWEFILAEL